MCICMYIYIYIYIHIVSTALRMALRRPPHLAASALNWHPPCGRPGGAERPCGARARAYEASLGLRADGVPTPRDVEGGIPGELNHRHQSVLIPQTCHFCACRVRRGNSLCLAKSSRYAGPSAGAEVACLRKWHVWCLPARGIRSAKRSLRTPVRKRLGTGRD